MTALWPHIRAALVLLHVVALIVMAFPAPGGLVSRSAWNTPNARDDFNAWGEALGVDGGELKARLWKISRVYVYARAAVHRPLRPYQQLAGTYQGWSMFTSPQRHPTTLGVEVEQETGWQAIYASRSDELTWRRPQFDHNRVRKLTGRFARDGNHESFDHFARWIAKQVAADFPTASRARVSLYRQHSLTHERVAAGEQPVRKRIRARDFELEPLRARDSR